MYSVIGGRNPALSVASSPRVPRAPGRGIRLLRGVAVGRQQGMHRGLRRLDPEHRDRLRQPRCMRGGRGFVHPRIEGRGGVPKPGDESVGSAYADS